MSDLSLPIDLNPLYYFVIIIGPLLIIDTPILVLLIKNYMYEDKALFIDKVITKKTTNLLINRCLGYSICYYLISATFFSFVYKPIYDFFGIEYKTIFMVAWDYSIYMNNLVYMVLYQISIILVDTFLCMISLLYMFLTSKTDPVS